MSHKCFNTLEECIKETNSILLDVESVDIRVNNKVYSIKLGDVFNRLTVIKFVKHMENKYYRVCCICKCSCGNIVGPSRINFLIIGKLKSCGCLSTDRCKNVLSKINTKHGDSHSKEFKQLYTIWNSMVNRSTNHNNKSSKYYVDKLGDNCICEEWRKDYLSFKEWALNNGYKNNLSLDRIDNSKGYFPDNCRWIPLGRQASNQTTNRKLTYNNRTETLADWSRITGLNHSTIWSRLDRGETIGQALGFEPIKRKKNVKKLKIRKEKINYN